MLSYKERREKTSTFATGAMLRSALLIALILAVFPNSAHAVITATNLTTGGDGNQAASYNTASISPGAYRLVLAWVVSAKNGGASLPSLSGNGLTWVQVNTVVWNVDHRLTLFRAMGAAPTPGPVTVDFGPVQKAAAWTIDEFDGVDPSGTNGSGAIVQNLAGFDDLAGLAGLTITFPLPIGSGNATAGGFANADNVLSLSPGAGYTGFPQTLIINPPIGLMSEWRPDGNTTVNASQIDLFPMAGIAVEIKPPILPLVKQAWLENGSAPLASPLTAPVGSTIVFLIYVKNTMAIDATDVRINDILDETAFSYVAGSLRRTNNLAPPADTDTDLTIFNKSGDGTSLGQTDAADTSPATEVASALNTVGLPDVDQITIGAVPTQLNASLTIGAHTTFALRFRVIVK